MKRRLLSLGFATMCTLLLGAVSALTFTMLGPAVQILLDPHRQTAIPLSELLGPRLAVFASWILGTPSLGAAQLWSQLPLALVVSAFLRALLSIIQWFLWERSSELVARDMRQELIDSYLHLQPEARRVHTRTVDQEIAAGVSNDIRLLREFLVHFFGGFPRELILVVFYLITLFLLEPTLASFFLLGLGPAGVLLSRLGKKMRKRSQKVLDNSSSMVEWLQQRLSGIETIKQYRTESFEQKQLDQLSDRLFGLFVKAARIKARTSPLMEIIAIGAMMLVLGYALRQIAVGTLNSSVLLSFFAILANLSQSASKLGRYFNSNKEGEAALARLEQLHKTMKFHSKAKLDLCLREQQPWALEIKDLTYSYAPDQAAVPPALFNINLRLARGRIFAIAGPSGSGKTTLLKLILGLWQLQKGELNFGLKSMDQLGYLPQHIQLMPGPLASNISYPDPEFDEVRLADSLARVGLLSFVEALPETWNSRVGEGGNVTLSGGQAQRVQLARLIYHRFSLVVIDEGTSALDPETEAMIFKTLREMAQQGATLILVAHRIAALQIADELVVLKRGQLFYQGDPNGILSDSSWQELFEVPTES